MVMDRVRSTAQRYVMTHVIATRSMGTACVCGRWGRISKPPGAQKGNPPSTTVQPCQDASAHPSAAAPGHHATATWAGRRRHGHADLRLCRTRARHHHRRQPIAARPLMRRQILHGLPSAAGAARERAGGTDAVRAAEPAGVAGADPFHRQGQSALVRAHQQAASPPASQAAHDGRACAKRA